MRKVVVAADSFKGSLTSAEANQAIATGIHSVYPECEIIRLSIADGGEGFAATLTETLCGTMVQMQTYDPLMRPITASYGLLPSHTAVIETAASSGLPLLSVTERNPLKTTTYGTGEQIKHAIQQGCRHILLGLGGSATCDAGVGLLQALGYRFYDNHGHIVSNGTGGEILQSISHIDDTNILPELNQTTFTLACDVTNPLYGPKGAAYIFGPQKGANKDAILVLDNGLRSFATILQRHTGTSTSHISGAGAAGGIGGTLHALFNATLHSGINLLLDTINFEHIITNADLIITGEGRIDPQTTMGKAAHGILQRAKRQGIPVIALGGSIALPIEAENNGFCGVFCIQTSPITWHTALKPDYAYKCLRYTTQQIMHTIKGVTGI